MDLNSTKHIIEAALLAANSSLSFDRLVELLAARGVEVDRAALRDALSALARSCVNNDKHGHAAVLKMSAGWSEGTSFMRTSSTNHREM